MPIEFVYQIHAPSLADFFNEKVFSIDDESKQVNYIVYENVQGLIKDSYINFMNFTWKYILYFKKSNTRGSIHTDLNDNACDNTKCIWGINWIKDGNGIIEYWDFNDVELYKSKTEGSLNNPSFGRVPSFFTLKNPIKRYYLKNDKIYIINATQPHRAAGGKNRKAFSLRPTDESKSWDEIVKIFKPIII